MELTGGYLEETITVDVTTGRKSCAIYIQTFVDKGFKGNIFVLHGVERFASLFKVMRRR